MQTIDHALLAASGFGVSKLKAWTAREGQGYTYTLTYRGAPVAHVEQGGYGGPTDLVWNGLYRNGTPMASDVSLTPARRKKAEGEVLVSRFAREKWAAFVASIPPVPSFFDGEDLDVSEDMALEELLNLHNLRKLVAKKTVFEVGGNTYTVNAPFHPDVAAWIEKRHPGAVILNAIPHYTTA